MSFEIVRIGSEAVMNTAPECVFNRNDIQVRGSLIPLTRSEAQRVWFVSSIHGDEFGQFETKEKAIDRALIVEKVALSFPTGLTLQQALKQLDEFTAEELMSIVADMDRLHITREVWELIDDRWQFAAMDSDGAVVFYEEEPFLLGDGWLNQDGSTYSQCPLKLNLHNVQWDKSLTKRPEME
ncbi:hypothetical protein LPW36_02140 [Jinshanibacter sp. LJY008]|uniref:Uncharacterized protein n=1 Tax=Limnobaculum eriocheiris TaxID=2897391 RepID=A0A9X1MVB9_9GAMM|nr:hypothetical protein [Limnobaculum eriocheiris]MCD1124845.1 hypothetical protein [Limnobaculum eriocheiris]